MKKIKLKNRVTALTSVIILTAGLSAQSFSFDVKAEALPEILEGSSTIADFVMSYYALTGSAVANVTWIEELYDGFGSSFGTLQDFANEGLMTFENGVWKPLEQLTNDIANNPTYTNLKLDEVFNVSQNEVISGGGLIASSGAATLAGSAGSVASTGVLPVLGGVTAAYWGGIAVGTLAAHLLGLYDQRIYNAQPITFSDSEMASITEGDSVAKSKYRTSTTEAIYYSDTVRLYFVGYINSANKLISTLVCYNFGRPNETFTFNYSYKQTESWDIPKSENFDLNSSGVYLMFRDEDKRDKNNTNPIKLYSSSSEYRTALNNLVNSGISDFVPYSPDLIGENGNLVGNKNNSAQIVVPDMKPQIDPGVEAGKPLTKEDWLNFANGVSNNNSGIDPFGNNQNLFQDIINNIKVPVPSNIPGGNPQPDNPGETYPVPGPTPDSYPVPDNDYQPETKPQPEYTEKPTENETDITTGDPWTTPNLLDKFPFCIPRDVYRVFTKLDSGSRSAPHIQWRFHPNEMIDYTFDIDFAEWDSVAVLLRALELLGFIVALAVATRKMILS